MKKQYLLHVFLMFLLLAACQNRNSQTLETDNYTVHSDDISNQSITCFGEDDLGYIWIGTSRGANKYNGYEYVQYLSTDDSASLSSNLVQQIYNDSKGRIWIATAVGVNLLDKQGNVIRVPYQSHSTNIRQIRETTDGRIFINTAVHICEFDEEQMRFITRYSLADDEHAPIEFFIDRSNRIWCVGLYHITCFDPDNFNRLYRFTNDYTLNAFMRSNGEIWYSQPSGMKIIDTKTGSRVPVPQPIVNKPVLAGSIINLVHPYDDVSVLIRTDNDGLFYYNFYNGEVLHQSENGFPFEVPDMEITALYTDKNKNLWIGSYDQGFIVRYNYKQRFNTNDYLRAQLDNKSVVAVTVDKEKNLWIATRRHGLFRWSESENRLTQIPFDIIYPGISDSQIRFTGIFVDSDNHVWLQMYNHLAKCRILHDGTLQAVKKHILPDHINCLTEDRHGTIWAAGTSECVYKLPAGSETFERVAVYPVAYHFTNGLMTLSNGKVMMATFHENIRVIDPDNGVIEEIDIHTHLNGQIFIPIALYEDVEGFVWIGTIEAGLFRYSLYTGEIEHMNGIDCRDISSITEDVHGNIWIGTLYGLSKFDRTVNQFTNYYASDGIGGNQFNARSVCRLPDNTLVFGGTHGLTLFNPIDVSTRREIPLFVEDLKVHNRYVKPVKGGVIDHMMVYSPTVQLAWHENSIQLNYAALDYSEYPRIQYSYMLEGFDTKWIDAGNYRQAFYSNLPAGKYTFKVKVDNPENTITETITAIPVIITSAPWFSVYAIIGYIILFFVMVYFVFRIYRHLQAKRREALDAIREKEQEQHVNRMNMSFFSNISHEFRTPLTMISGPIGMLYNSKSLSGEERQLLQIIHRNVRRMLRLVNQLMDFNKLENDTLRLEVEEADAIHILNEHIRIYELNAEEKGIRLNRFGLKDTCRVWVDVDKLEKIMSNLLQNALKFTQSGGRIDVKFDVIPRDHAALLFPLSDADTDTEYMKVSVGDTGSGIPEDKLEDVFQKYSQIDNQSNVYRNWGTGIGLYFARRMAEMHHGYIKAENKPQGGSLFTFILPVNEGSYTVSERRKAAGEQKPFVNANKPEVLVDSFRRPGEPAVEEDQRPVVLVVDDDSEVAYFLKTLLAKDYQVAVRYNAEKAWEAIEEVEPDLIISDVLMPGTDGYTFCRRIKENLSTCHIPVILLTAKVTAEEHIEGMNAGANAYVTKPFDAAYLLALVGSQLRNRDNARRLLVEKTDTASLAEEVLSAQDKAFMDNLYSLMEKELSNPEVNVTQMIDTLKISRTKFYYKVKGLTGENPNSLFKSYKLNRAAELMREGKYHMAEIADKTGFSTPSHFSASFKKKFGVTPSEYISGMNS